MSQSQVTTLSMDVPTCEEEGAAVLRLLDYFDGQKLLSSFIKRNVYVRGSVRLNVFVLQIRRVFPEAECR